MGKDVCLSLEVRLPIVDECLLCVRDALHTIFTSKFSEIGMQYFFSSQVRQRSHGMQAGTNVLQHDLMVSTQNDLLTRRKSAQVLDHLGRIWSTIHVVA